MIFFSLLFSLLFFPWYVFTEQVFCLRPVSNGLIAAEGKVIWKLKTIQLLNMQCWSLSLIYETKACIIWARSTFVHFLMKIREISIETVYHQASFPPIANQERQKKLFLTTNSIIKTQLTLLSVFEFEKSLSVLRHEFRSNTKTIGKSSLFSEGKRHK